MHCVSSYPLNMTTLISKNSIILEITFLNMDTPDTVEGIDDAIFALSYGSLAVEKHFTIDKNLPGRDNKFAILPEELKQICKYSNNCNLMRQEHGLELQDEE